MLLKDKVAIITGGAGVNGLGFASARMMAAQGARVVILDLDKAQPASVAATLGQQHMGVVADVTNKASCDAAIKAVMEKFGQIDILFNNAGITQPRKTMEITAADYEAVLDVSLRGALYMSQAVLPHMRARKQGSIICTSSVSAQYSAAKAGVLGLARAMARECGVDNIRVNCITPGLIETDINKGLIPADRMTDILSNIPMNRIGEPNDVAGCVVFLASDLSKYCTGITLDVNGGMLIH
jgi:NAD(P)-dependent dehydrogenase (short-subunit alcohol dehydrogenase family)